MKRLEADSMKQQDVRDNETSAESFVGKGLPLMPPQVLFQARKSR